MDNGRFIDRYFESESILLKIEHTEKKNINTLLTYLENLLMQRSLSSTTMGMSFLARVLIAPRA